MRPDSIADLRTAYDAYVDTFRSSGGELPDMMQLKLVHTRKVVENAVLIAKGEGFDGRTTLACEATALLHDTGRYEQLRVYNTFRDSDSVDHAVFSHDIVKERGWLDGWRDGDAILNAVLWHNRREIPEGISDPVASACARTVRDADKLDIFRVLEERVENTDWRSDSRAFWNLSLDAPPNPAVVAAIRERRPVEYQEITCLADFVLVQIGWMVSGLEYATSRRLCMERGHLWFRRRFLGEIAPGSAADGLCDLAEAALVADSGGGTGRA
jgi:hypothetical protein